MASDADFSVGTRGYSLPGGSNALGRFESFLEPSVLFLADRSSRRSPLMPGRGTDERVVLLLDADGRARTMPCEHDGIVRHRK